MNITSRQRKAIEVAVILGIFFLILVTVGLFASSVYGADDGPYRAAQVTREAHRDEVPEIRSWWSLTGCDLMAYHAEEFELPEMFGGWLGFAESSCRNDVTSPTGCCSGYWQIHYRWVDWAPPERLAACGVVEASDWLGADPVARSRNACMARIVYDIQGPCAWTPYHNRFCR